MNLFRHFLPFKIVILAASSTLHLISFAQFQWIYGYTEYASEALALVPILLLVSLTISVAMFYVKRRLYFLFLLTLRFAVLLFIGELIGHRIFIELILLLSLLLETAIYEGFPSNLFINIGLVVLSLIFIKISSAGTGWADFLLLPDTIFYFTSSTSFGLVASLVTHFREKMIMYQEGVIRLDNALLELTKANVGYMDMARTASERSTQEERQRITRELHDTSVYTLTNLSIMMEAAKDLIEADLERLRETLDEAAEQAQRGLSDIRNALYLLRKQEVNPEKGIKALTHMIRFFERATSIPVRIELGNVPFSCGEQIDSALYHLVQEGLTNSFRHGKATQIRFLMWRDNENSIQVSLSDNGEASGPIKEGIGISGMRERLGKLGGTLKVEALPHGFQIVAEIPMEG